MARPPRLIHPCLGSHLHVARICEHCFTVGVGIPGFFVNLQRSLWGDHFDPFRHLENIGLTFDIILTFYAPVGVGGMAFYTLLTWPGMGGKLDDLSYNVTKMHF